MNIDRWPQQRQAKDAYRRYGGLDHYAAFCKLLQLAASHGLYVCVSDIPAAIWDGREHICVRPHTPGIVMLSDLAHELGHYAVATPSMRAKPEYGLGMPAGGRRWLDSTIGELGDGVEQQASVFGQVLERWAGVDPGDYTWEEHQWQYERSALERVWAIIRSFRKLGLLQGFALRDPTGHVMVHRAAVIERAGYGVCEMPWPNGRNPFMGWRIPFCEAVDRKGEERNA